jgi:hypothetical protein
MSSYLLCILSVLHVIVNYYCDSIKELWYFHFHLAPYVSFGIQKCLVFCYCKCFVTSL